MINWIIECPNYAINMCPDGEYQNVGFQCGLETSPPDSYATNLNEEGTKNIPGKHHLTLKPNF